MDPQSVPLDHAFCSCIDLSFFSTIVSSAFCYYLLVVSDVFCSVFESLAWEGDLFISNGNGDLGDSEHGTWNKEMICTDM